ncbi:Roundabout 4 [Desmophyllum pertusum]|uniref:Roundabout 4 n=1 Tax=Desmophyllum pertusum TaxID=174260 RepID=A0A9X0D174_9CNID|nr:Roundabout 4 [Desmophyllum pertusum]
MSRRGVLTVVGAEKHDIGSYVCHAKNYLGEASAVTSLVVLSVPKFNTKPPETVNKVPGDELSLSCSATGDPPPTISWKRANGAWEEKRMEVHGGSLKISSLTESDSGIYICEATVPYYTIEAMTELVVVKG